MTWLVTLDAALLHWINSTGSNPVFDFLLPLFREKWFWAPLYLFVLVFFLQNSGSRRGMILIFGLVIAAGLADFTSSTLIKKNVRRLRPCNDPAIRELVVQRVPCGSGYSFTSSHAANHFAAAVFLSFTLGTRIPRVRLGLLVWASIVAYSQVYVGVHYPSDVLCGGLLGAAIGSLVAHGFDRLLGRNMPEESGD
ncbi:MAG: phosphatase PAP2 family protein [Lewinellaceae bacterium]|nr:phosphatase PAP2 family protein [Lewinellaceae bacterium]